MFKRINCHLTGHKKALWAWGTKPYNTAPHFISIGSRGDASIGLLQLPQGKSSETDNKSIDCHKLATTKYLGVRTVLIMLWMISLKHFERENNASSFFLITNGVNAAAARPYFHASPWHLTTSSSLWEFKKIKSLFGAQKMKRLHEGTLTELQV